MRAGDPRTSMRLDQTRGEVIFGHGHCVRCSLLDGDSSRLCMVRLGGWASQPGGSRSADRVALPHDQGTCVCSMLEPVYVPRRTRVMIGELRRAGSTNGLETAELEVR